MPCDMLLDTFQNPYERNSRRLHPPPPPTMKEELILCLMDLIEDQEGEFKDRSEDWINTIDRGGLKHINNNTYMVMHAIEMC